MLAQIFTNIGYVQGSFDLLWLIPEMILGVGEALFGDPFDHRDVYVDPILDYDLYPIFNYHPYQRPNP